MRYLLFSILIQFAFSAYGQQNKIDKNFISDFEKALNKHFSEEQLNKMFQDYAGYLTPHSDVTQLTENLKGNTLSNFPLYDFKREKLYTDNIENLINSQNSNHRILAYLVIASSGDTAQELKLLEKLKTEEEKGNLIWAGMALLHLKCNHTTELFDFLIKNEDFGDAHMLPLFMRLNKDSLQQTAYRRINSEDDMTKILAAQILSVTPLNVKTENLLKQAVKNWDINIKGYAIYSIKELQIGNLLETFKPFLDSSQTRAIALEALANSPTQIDRNYLFSQVNKQDTIPEELLDCFYESKNVENLKYWLKVLYSKPTPKKYIFFVFNQPLLHSDNILTELQTALQKITDPEILAELVRALEGRQDDASIGIMTAFLKHENSSVRYWTAKTLKNNKSPVVQSREMQELINKGLKDGN